MKEFAVSMFYERKIIPIEVSIVSARDEVVRDGCSLDHREGKQVVEERAELIKYSSLQQLGETLNK